jgi:ribosomal protein L11 methyltransferase
MTNLWFEITARVPPDQVEPVAELMRTAAPGGITVEEPIDILGPEMGYRVRPGEPLLVRAYLPSSELGAVLTEDLRRSMEAFPAVELVAKPIFEQDWAVSWREFFGVVDTGGRVVIVPSWIDYEAPPGKLPIRLDPGQAFGTGHHETTRLCLSALEDTLRPGMRVLDVGTGSGVLAIAAIKLGAASVDALDIDPIAAEVARANCDENGIGPEVEVRTGSLARGHASRYDLVISNISTPANTALAPHFGDVVSPGGTLILSGILSPDAQAVIDAMKVAGFTPLGVKEERDWCAIQMRRAG